MGEAAPKTEDGYRQISLKVLRCFKKPLVFNIFVRRTEGKFTKIFNQGDHIDWDRVASYEDKGLKFFYVDDQNFEKYTLLVDRLGEVLAQSGGKLNDSESLEILKEMIQITLDEVIVENHVSHRLAKNASNVVTTCVTGLAKSPKKIIQIVNLLSHHPKMFKHAVSVTLFSILISGKLEIKSEENLKSIGMGAFLHDIGLSQLTWDPYSEPFHDDPEKRKEYEKHPEIGKEILDILPRMKSEVLNIVLQHHERVDGKGFPNNLKRGEFFNPSQIVGVADSFIGLVTDKGDGDVLSTEMALSHLKKDTGNFEKVIIKALEDVIFSNK